MTSFISGGLIGAPVGSTYTDAQAVAAYKADRDFQGPINRFTPAGATGAFASYLMMTTGSLLGGLYGLTINALSGGAAVNAGTQIEFAFSVDAGPNIVGAFKSYGVAGGRFVEVAATIDLPPFAPGVHTVDFLFRGPGGPGTAQMLEAHMSLDRYPI